MNCRKCWSRAVEPPNELQLFLFCFTKAALAGSWSRRVPIRLRMPYSSLSSGSSEGHRRRFSYQNSQPRRVYTYVCRYDSMELPIAIENPYRRVLWWRDAHRWQPIHGLMDILTSETMGAVREAHDEPASTIHFVRRCLRHWEVRMIGEKYLGWVVEADVKTRTSLRGSSTVVLGWSTPLGSMQIPWPRLSKAPQEPRKVEGHALRGGARSTPNWRVVDEMLCVLPPAFAGRREAAPSKNSSWEQHWRNTKSSLGHLYGGRRGCQLPGANSGRSA